MTQISTRYEKMGPICTRRIIHINNQTDEQQPTRREAGYNSPYYERGETSDYVFALFFGMAGILLSHVLLLPKLPSFIIQHHQYHRFFNRHLTFYVVYIWSKQHQHHRVNLFGMPMAAAYLPYAYLCMGYALNNQQIPVDILHG